MSAGASLRRTYRGRRVRGFYLPSLSRISPNRARILALSFANDRNELFIVAIDPISQITRTNGTLAKSTPKIILTNSSVFTGPFSAKVSSQA